MRTFLLIAVLCSLAVYSIGEEGPKGKYAIILQAGAETNEAKARAAHALLYAKELLENGYEVALIYDGAGTGWATEFRNPENGFNKQYLLVKNKGMFEEVCKHCADHFDVEAKLLNQEKMLYHLKRASWQESRDSASSV